MIITFAHYKGGTGKTTSCISTAGCLAKAGKQVLVVDLDPQANSTGGLGIKKSSGYTMHHVMEKKVPISKVILETELDNIHIAPSNYNLMKTDLKIYKSKKDAKILKNALKEVEPYYDSILIDTPPSNAHFLINGLAAADKVYIVLDTGIFSLEVVENLARFFKEANKKYDAEIKIDKILLNKCKNSKLPFFKDKATYEIEKEISKYYKDKLYKIPYSNIVYETNKRGVPISHYKPKSKIGKAFSKLANELV